MHEPPPSSPDLSIARRAAMWAVAAFVVYGNLAVAVQPPMLQERGITPLPTARWLRDAFLIPGMFSGYSRSNLDPYLGGLRTNAGASDDRGRWIRLPLGEHFAGRHGITFLQLYAMHHRDSLGQRAQREAWARMARRIRARHNRLHPRLPIERVRFGAVLWPISPEGYRAEKHPPNERAVTWFEEPASNGAPAPAADGAPR